MDFIMFQEVSHYTGCKWLYIRYCCNWMSSLLWVIPASVDGHGRFTVSVISLSLWPLHRWISKSDHRLGPFNVTYGFQLGLSTLGLSFLLILQLVKMYIVSVGPFEGSPQGYHRETSSVIPQLVITQVWIQSNEIHFASNQKQRADYIQIRLE